MVIFKRTIPTFNTVVVSVDNILISLPANTQTRNEHLCKHLWKFFF